MKYSKFAAAAAALLLAACSDGGFQRGVFYGKVIDKSPADVASQFGQPSSIDQSAPDNPRYVYVKKTFNPDDMNKVDEKTVVEFGERQGRQDRRGRCQLSQLGPS